MATRARSLHPGDAFGLTEKEKKKEHCMINQFNFKNFDANDATRSKANFALSKILDRAPYDSTAVALLEKLEDGYRCSVDIYSRQGPFMASTVRATALDAIQAIESKLKYQIEWWWSHRGSCDRTVKTNFSPAAS
jgi:hypothetical protein